MIIFIDNLIIILTILFIFWFIISYTCHIEMNKRENLPYDYVNFDTFIKVFNEYFNKYKNNPGTKIEYGFDGWSAFFMYDKDYNRIIYLHASIVKFENRCMIFYPLSWIRYCIWMRQYRHVKKRKINRHH